MVSDLVETCFLLLGDSIADPQSGCLAFHIQRSQLRIRIRLYV